MATFSLIKSLIRDELNELSTVRLSETELGAIVNDGYKDASVKSLAYEKKIAKTNIAAGERLISLAGENVIKINYVEYDLGSSGCVGMVKITPSMVGFVPIDGYTPQYWYQFGDFLVVEPVPDVGTYDLNVYASCYPDTAMAAAGDTPANLPLEFHDSLVDIGQCYAAMKLCRWGASSSSYNYYHQTMRAKQLEYIKKIADRRSYRAIPDAVTAQQRQEQ